MTRQLQQRRVAARPMTAFVICFALVAGQSLLSYPVYLLVGSDFCEAVADFSGGHGYLLKSFVVTLGTFAALLVLYRVLPTRRHAVAFVLRPFARASDAYYAKAWALLATIICLNCFILFWQAGYVLPLLQGRGLDATEFAIYRRQYAGNLSSSLANLNAHMLVPMLVFISFFCIRRGAHVFRVISLVLLAVAATFSLSRSFLPTSLLVILLSYAAFKPVPISRFYRLAMPLGAVGMIALALVSYSTKESYTASMQKMGDRLVHGQWLGMPLYLYYFEGAHAEPATLLHPALRSVLDLSVSATPGRELMEYFNPAGVDNGSAGNIPTYFVGEGFAVFGMWGVWASVVIVSCMLAGFALMFNIGPKNHYSCCLYGWVMYKVASGLVCGVSAFLVSGLGVVLGLMIGWNLLMGRFRRRVRGVARQSGAAVGPLRRNPMTLRIS